MAKRIRFKPGSEAPVSEGTDSDGSSREPYPFLLPPVESGEIGRLGNYRVLGLLGRGGMGLVFHAEDLTLGRAVALKIMKPDLDGSVKGWERFLREARLMAAIKHEAIVPVYHAAQENGVIYLAMELLRGASLEDWRQSNERPDAQEVLRLGKEIARGLSAIHAHNLVHRDLKPSNLWLESPGNRVKILDFGLARFVQDDAGLTQTGNILGTPSFMSPEQARGEAVDHRSDLFSFGCILYTLCAGEEPFYAGSTAATLTALATKDPCPVRDLNPAIPRSLSNLVARLLAKDPAGRPDSATGVLEELERIEARVLGSGSTAVSPTLEQTPPRNSPPSPGSSQKRSARLSTAQRRRKVRTQSRRRSVAGLWATIVTLGVATTALTYALLTRTAGDTGGVDQTTVFLSALEPVSSRHWPFLPPPAPGGPPITAIGGVVSRGQPSPHGIFMHPPPAHEGAASLSYALGKKFTRFQAKVSMNDGPPRSEFPFVFALYGDGRLLWQSRPVVSQADTQTCSVALEDVDVLTLTVTSHGGPRGAHAVWIEPQVGN
jgi:serine/threonine protein kinase